MSTDSAVATAAETTAAESDTEGSAEEFEFTEIEEFHDFLTRKLMAGQRTLTAVECLAEFREFIEQKSRFLRELDESRKQAQRGESGPLDVEGMMARVRARAAAKGITD